MTDKRFLSAFLLCLFIGLWGMQQCNTNAKRSTHVDIHGRWYDPENGLSYYFSGHGPMYEFKVYTVAGELCGKGKAFVKDNRVKIETTTVSDPNILGINITIPSEALIEGNTMTNTYVVIGIPVTFVLYRS